MQKTFLTTLFLSILAGLICAMPVYADDTRAQLQELSTKGTEAFNDEDFEAAVGYFEEAYELRQIPDLLFNIGRCYEQLGEWSQAIENFERYVRAPDTDDEIRDHTMDRIQSLRDFERGEERAAQEADEVRRTARHTIRDMTTIEVEEPSNFKGFATLGTGGGLLLGGLLFGMMASSNADDIGDTSMHYDERLSAQSSARTQGRVADIFFLTGTAATMLGAYFLFFSGDSDAGSAGRSGSDRLMPWVRSDGAGVGLSLDF